MEEFMHNTEELKKIFLEFGHWIAIGISGIIVICVLVLSGDKNSQTTQADAKASLDKLIAQKAKKQTPPPDLPNYEEIIFKNWKTIQIADSELFSPNSFKDIARWVALLRDAKDSDLPLFYLRENCSKKLKEQIQNYKNGDPISSEFTDLLINDLNCILAQTNPDDTSKKIESLYSPIRFGKYSIRPQLSRFLGAVLQGDDLIRFNRWILEDAYSDEIVPYRRIGQDFFYEEGQYKFQRGKAPNYQWIAIPKNLALKIDREKIDISWEPPEPEQDSKTGKEKELTSIDGYQLQKTWTENSKKNEQLFLFDGMANTTYEDKDTKAKIDYKYQIRAYTLNTKAQGGQLETLMENKKPKLDERNQPIQVIFSNYSKPEIGTILPSYQIKVLGVSEDTAFLKMDKWQKGKWRTRTFRVKKGNKIEFRDFEKEIDEVIDFSPGWTLISAKSDAWIEKDTIKKVIRLDDKGNPMVGYDKKLIYDEKIVKIKVKVAAIVYRDEYGKEEIKYQEP